MCTYYHEILMISVFFICTSDMVVLLLQDRDNNPRVTGEEWLVKKIGAYLPGAYEEVVDVVDAYVLTEKVLMNVCHYYCIVKCTAKNQLFYFAVIPYIAFVSR